MNLERRNIAAIIRRHPNQADYCAERIVKLVEKNFTSTNTARDEIAAAEKLCKIYFDIAASCIGEDAVRQRVAAATSPVA